MKCLLHTIIFILQINVHDTLKISGRTRIQTQAA